MNAARISGAFAVALWAVNAGLWLHNGKVAVALLAAAAAIGCAALARWSGN